MDAQALRELQAPLKSRYQEAPESALITLTAEGRLGENLSCKVDTGRAIAEAGLHPATGGDGSQLCSGDMLLEALVACAGVTMNAVATALGIEKIDVADKGGYVVFGPDSRIDPLALVKLVQNDSRRYRLQGSNRLQLNDDLGDLERRFATIEDLLSLLAVKEGHDD